MFFFGFSCFFAVFPRFFWGFLGFSWFFCGFLDFSVFFRGFSWFFCGFLDFSGCFFVLLGFGTISLCQGCKSAVFQ